MTAFRLNFLAEKVYSGVYSHHPYDNREKPPPPQFRRFPKAASAFMYQAAGLGLGLR